LRRLFSTFADGWPGAGLLFMRLVAGSVLVTHGWLVLRTGASSGQAALAVTCMAGGTFLLAGLWTPIAGTLVTVLEGWRAIANHGDPSTSILLGTLAGALAVLGPGAWSLDARLYGWKRIDIRKQRRRNGSH
jgi:putative oxidoreductase